MKMIGFTVELCYRDEIKNFIEKWHYSRSINGVRSRYCFKIINSNNELTGAMIYAGFGMANVWRKYAKSEDKVLELRRLCCIDDTPKNIESFFISKTLKWIKQNTKVEIVISYADDFYNHKGIIYQASNFEYLGTTSPNRMIEWNGKLWHDKTIRAYYNGKLKPYAQKIKDALVRGEARYVNSRFKYIYKYTINRHFKYRKI